MPSELHIRRYRPGEDDDVVWELHVIGIRQTGTDIGHGPWDDDLRAIEASYIEKGGDFLVGEVDGQAVAIGGIVPITDNRAELKRMRVHPAYQRRGFGEAILHALEQRARQAGIRHLFLDTTLKQRAAVALYRKHGYREIGESVIGGFDCLVFEKDLVLARSRPL